MATVLRVRGSEVQVRLTNNGQLERTLVDFKSCTIVGKFTKLIEKFLGQPNDKVDEQFDHVEGTLVVQPESQDLIRMIFQIKDRATRAVSQDLLKINLAATLQFPNGQRPRILVPDLKFGDLPLNVGGRDQYVDTTFDWAADTYDRVLT